MVRSMAVAELHMHKRFLQYLTRAVIVRLCGSWLCAKPGVALTLRVQLCTLIAFAASSTTN
jgi:hypothetical protein